MCQQQLDLQRELLSQVPGLPDVEVNVLEELLATLVDAPVNTTYPDDPTTLKEAMASEDAEEWSRALHEDFKSIKEMGVFKLIPRSSVPHG